MWVIEGQFDGLHASEETKRKALFAGEKYPLGRAQGGIQIQDKVVSLQTAILSVATHNLSDAGDLDTIPTLEYTQIHKSKSATINREGFDPISVAPQHSQEIQDGDLVQISGGKVCVTFTWVPINILFRSGVSRDERTAAVEAFAKFGIKTARVWTSQITHVVFSAVSVPCDLKVLAPLVHGSHIVSPAWLQHVIKRGQSKDADESLEFTYDGLDEEKFRPERAGLQAWAPNKKRKKMFAGLRFLLLTVPDAPQDLGHVLAPGDLAVHQIAMDDSTTLAEWKEKLETMKRKADKKPKPGMDCPFVLLGDTEALEQEAADQWNSVYLKGIQTLGVRMVWLPELSNAVLKNDLTYVDCWVGAPAATQPSEPNPEAEAEGPRRRSTRASSRAPSLPPVVPSTHPSEPSLNTIESKGSKVTLTRRATRPSATPAPPEPQDDDIMEIEKPPPLEPEAPPPPKTILKRRATARRAGSREPTAAPSPAVGPSAPSPNTSGFITPSIPASRGLKRRVTGKAATAGTSTNTHDASIREEEEDAEPKHKKYKALFEGTQTMDSLPEVEEVPGTSDGTGSLKPSLKKASKRKAIDLMDIDEEVEEEEAMTKKQKTLDTFLAPSSNGLQSQISATASSSSPSSITPSQSQQNSEYQPPPAPTQKKKQVKIESPNGKITDTKTIEPDKEPQFLQALASRTKTKAKEDHFDREFNQLRIAVPDKHKAEDEDRRQRELDVWNEVDHDPGVRGNFMVVELCDLTRKDGGARKNGQGASNMWSGLPNFKKFQKKNAVTKGPKVELELPPPVDYGMGDAYWQDAGNTTMGGEAVALPAVQSQQPASQRPPKTAAPPRKRMDLRVESSEEEEPPPPPPKRTKSSKKTPAIDLHFSDDDDEDEAAVAKVVTDEDVSEIFDMNVSAVPEDDEDDDAPPVVSSHTLKSTGSKRTAPSTQSQRSSKAGGSSSKSKRKVIQIVADDDDDDDDMAFKGFGRNKRAKR